MVIPVGGEGHLRSGVRRRVRVVQVLLFVLVLLLGGLGGLGGRRRRLLGAEAGRMPPGPVQLLLTPSPGNARESRSGGRAGGAQVVALQGRVLALGRGRVEQLPPGSEFRGGVEARIVVCRGG